MFSCEFCEISKNTFLCRTPLVAASVITTKDVFYYQKDFTSEKQPFPTFFSHTFKRENIMVEL